MAACRTHGTLHVHSEDDTDEACWAAVVAAAEGELVCQVTGLVLQARIPSNAEHMGVDAAHRRVHEMFSIPAPPLVRQGPHSGGVNGGGGGGGGGAAPPSPLPPRAPPPAAAARASIARATLVAATTRGLLFPSEARMPSRVVARAAAAHARMVAEARSYAGAPHVPACAIVARYLARTADALDVGTEANLARLAYYAERVTQVVRARELVASPPSAAAIRTLCVGTLSLMASPTGLRRCVARRDVRMGNCAGARAGDVVHLLPPDPWLARVLAASRAHVREAAAGESRGQQGRRQKQRLAERIGAAGPMRLVRETLDGLLRRAEARGADARAARGLVRELVDGRVWFDADTLAMRARGLAGVR